jgi:hypothetical protein
LKLQNHGFWELNPIDKQVFFSEQVYAILEIEENSTPSLALLKSRLISSDDIKLFEKTQIWLKK